MTRSPDCRRLASSVTTLRVMSPAGTITHTMRSPAGNAATRSASVGTSVTAGLRSKPVTSMPPVRIRSRMFAPILPSPIRPMCMTVPLVPRRRPTSLPWTVPATERTDHAASLARLASAGEPDGHQEVAVLRQVVALERLLAGELDGLVRVGERHPYERCRQRPQPVEQELRVERDRDVVTHESRLEGLRRLGIITLARVEHHLTLAERQPDRGVALGDERDPLGRIRQGLGEHDGVDRGLVREQPTHGRVVAVDEERGRVATAGLEPDEVDTLAGRECDVH